jgi:hypothetical protein
MKVYDLTYVEDEIIAGIEKYFPQMGTLNARLQQKAQGLAAAQAAKEEAKKNGTAGLAEVSAIPLTKPVSPKLTKQRLPKLPEPEKIEQTVSQILEAV